MERLSENEDSIYDDPWTDGGYPHRCGFFVEDHSLVYKKRPDGTSRSQWECPVGYPA